MKKSAWKKFVAGLLVVTMLLSDGTITGLLGTMDNVKAADSSETISAKTSSTKVAVPDDRIYITSTKYNLVPGATETVLTTNNEEGTDQRIGFIMEVDAEAVKEGRIKPVATYKDYQYETYGMQTVTDQAKAYENCHEDEKVFAGTNADFYNLNTGEVSGAFVMEGVIYKKVNSPYFAILKDGTAVVRDASHTDLSDVQEAVAGNMQIITNGVVTVQEGDYQTLSYSRTAVGVKENGDIITYVTHGISRPTSCGETYVDVAEIMLAQGCVNAVMLDGGGSATYASWREGEDGLKVQNNPSDGTPRTVANALLFASTVASDGEFDHASLTPNNEYYTPSSFEAKTVVEFQAVGVDGSGAVCDLPESGITWALAEDSQAKGQIDEATGVFTAGVGSFGTVNVNLLHENEIVGSTSIELVEPDEVYFAASGVSLDFEERSDLQLVVKGNGVELNTKSGDFTWTIKSTLDDVADELIGTMDGNIFVAGSKQDYALEGTASVSYTRSDDTELTASITLEIGKMPIVKMDFEDVDTNERGKDVVGLWDWGTTSTYFSDASDQVYEFQNYDILYYLQSTTYSSDSAWINEVYETEQPWTENEDGTTVTLTYKGKEYTGTKETTYGEHGQKWVSFTDENGDGYYWRGFIDGDTWSGNYNAGGGSASAFLGADGYDMYVWHASANKTSLASGELHGAGSQIVDASEGEVRFGDYALKLCYDFRNFSPTGDSKNCNTYYRMTEPLVADGSPTGLGMWVYAPEEMSNFWFWTRVHYWNGTTWTSEYIHFRPSGAEKTCQYTGVNWTGWAYVEADLSSIYTKGAVVDSEHPIQVRAGESLILLTYIPGGTSDGEGHSIVMGSRTKGYFYIDNVRFVYGTNVDDMDSPEIIATKANDTVLTADETGIIDTNDVSFSIDFTDPQGENYSGIDTTATQIYLDGTPLSSSKFAVTSDKAQTEVMTLANGEHTLLVSICDNFGNRTEQKYNFKVENPDSTIPTVDIERAQKAELGANYVITVKADDLSKITSVSTNITYSALESFETEKKTFVANVFYDDYGNPLTQAEDGNYYDSDGNLIEEPMRPGAGEFYVSSAVQKLGENLSGTIRNKASTTSRAFTATATVNETLTDDTTILTFSIPIPSGLAENVKFPYIVTINYTTEDGNTYTVTTGDIKTDIYAYYTITPGVQVAGAENGIFTITTADDENLDSENVKLYAGTEEVTGTFAGNVFITDYFVGQEANTTFNNVYVADDVNQHYSYMTVVNVAATAPSKDCVHYGLTLNATTSDSTTTENIVWLANTSANENAVVQYMTEADYANGKAFEDALSTSGESKLTRFGEDNYAVYINNVKISGLSAGTTYVYRAGDGETWSEIAEFSTVTDDGSTDFVVVADTQLLGDSTSASDQRAIAFLNAIGSATTNVDFGIQTGDFVDGGINYTMWDQILGVWEDSFVGKDFVHVMGNHENYGTEGSNISSAIFGLESSEKDYYSVEYGEVYIAVINQTADLTEAAAWLVEDAANTDCTWKVLTCHQPIYFTNPNGSNDGHHKVLKEACDVAGIDFTFSGHDHSYARTEQLKAGQPVTYETDAETNAYVDDNGDYINTKGEGTVYYICGDLGEKSRGSEYAIVDNSDFHFAKTSQEYDALYLTVTATEEKFVVNAWSMSEEGTKTLIDTYTMYTAAGICKEQGEHVTLQDETKYNAETGKLICCRCEAEIETDGYTGFAMNQNGADEYGDSQYYFLAGNIRTGFFTVGENIWYANENGLIDHLTENKNTNTCTENGNRTAYSPRYEKSFVGGKVPFTGHDYETKEDGSLVCTTCSHVAIDIADWDFSLSFTSTNYDGTAKTPAVNIVNPETGEKLVFATDGMGTLTDYTRVWSNNREVGTATVVINANPKGDYTNSKGEVVLTLDINPPLPTNVQVTDTKSTEVTITWDDVEQATGYRIYQYKNNKWSLIGTTTDTSYVVSNLNCSTDYQFAVKSVTVLNEKVYVSLKYTSAVEATTTAGQDINDWTVKLAFTSCTYNGNEKRPTPTVTDSSGTKMVRNTDYTVTYKNNVNVGTASVIIQGIGQYTGTKTVEFVIKQQSITAATIEVADAVYAGDETITTIHAVNNNNKVMTEGVDYELSFSENDSVGVAVVKITGIGNYKNSVEMNYNIIARDIKDMTASIAPEQELVYTGNPVEPVVVVNGLEEETDYIVTYENNINVGKGKATVTGIGNYQGTLSVEFEIQPKEMKDFEISDGSTYSYTGKAVEADLNVVSDTGVVLVEDTDYVIAEYRNNVNKGTATVVIEGIGNYTGTMEHEYEIQAADVKSFTIIVQPDTYTYSGGYREPKVTIVDANNNTLSAGKDYTLEYKNNKNAGIASVIVTGIGNYSGTAERNFTINPADISATNITLSYTTVTFTGGKKTPTVVVKTAKGTKLVEGKNYTVTYNNNKNAGTAEVIITGIGNYGGTKTVNFTITPADISKCTISLAETSYNYTGKEIIPTPSVVTAKGTVLKNGVSYVVEYSDNIEPGTAKAIVKGTGNYTGSVELEFEIIRTFNISECTVKLSYTSASYSGTAKRPAVTVTAEDGTKLLKGTDYKATYINNVDIGKAQVLIEGIGNYSGSITKTFTICPPKPTNLHVTKVTSNTIKVSFDRNENVDKYYIYVNGKYQGAALTVNYYTIKNLNANTSYQITVKAVKVVDGKNIYSISNPTITATTE